MRTYYFRILVALLTLTIGIALSQVPHLCRQNHTSRTKAPDNSQPVITLSKEKLWPQGNYLELEGDDTKPLAYRGYFLGRHYKTKTVEDPADGHGRITKYRVRVSYARLTRRAKTVQTFDADYEHPTGNATNYGLVSLLGPGTEQLAVSQSTWRADDYWIVDFGPTPRIIFHKSDWWGRWESLERVDLDNDGVDELTLASGAFYELQDKLPISQIPTPELVFKYDKRARKYLPAAFHYSDYLLRGLDDSIKKVDLQIRRTA